MTGGGGGQGVDRLFGYGGNDTMSVSNGTRGILIGGDGDDTLTGADQDDNLRAGDGTDILNGGAGYDQVTYRDKHSSTAAVTQGVFVNLSGAAATYDYNGTVGVTVQAGTAIDNWGKTDTLNSIERAEGSQLADGLVGNSDYNVLIGNNGDDILVGGGNTFQLLAEMRSRGLLDVVRARVAGGVPYAGWSAGANLACPTIRTTNDMPIVDPGGFDALGFVPYQINPHFTNVMPPGHQGETREQRLAEFVTANPAVPVLGVPEGDWIHVAGGVHTLHGPKDAVWIRHGQPLTPQAPGPLAI